MSFFKIDRSRRQFLQGTGGTLLAIPFMPSLAEAFGQSGEAGAIKRFVSIQMEDGHIGPAWRPVIASNTYAVADTYVKKAALPANMSPHMDARFDPFRSVMMTCVNVDGPFFSDHNAHTVLAAQRTSAFGASYTPPAAGRRYASIDQHISKVIYGSTTPQIDILNLALRYFSSAGTVGSNSVGLNASGDYVFSDAYGNLAAAWDYVFGRIPADAQTAARLQQERQLVADKVLASYRSFLSDRRLSAADKAALSDHVEQVDSLQRRIRSQAVAQCTPPNRVSLDYSENQGQNWDQAARTFFDMMVVALKCDMTRVVNFRLAPDVLLRKDSRFSTGHHDISHGGNPTLWAAMDQVFFDQLYYFVNRLQSEGLLDDTLVLVGNEIGNEVSSSAATLANANYDGHHATYDLQVLTFGRPDVFNTGYQYWFDIGPLRSGRWNRVQGVAYNEFLVTLMHGFGVPESSWKQAGVDGYGDYRGDANGLIQVNQISPAARRGKPIAALLK